MYQIAIFAIVAFLHFRKASASCPHNTPIYPPQGGGQPVEISDFGYIGVTGPTNWHALTDENVLCATGRNQSPIDINTTDFTTTNPGDVQTEIPAGQNTTFQNIGSQVKVVIEGTTTVAGRNFTLQQFHYHSPGEHLFDEEHYPVEVHFVHEAADGSGDIAVLGLLFQLTDDHAAYASGPSAVFSEVLESVCAIATPGTSVELPPLDFAPLTSALSSMTFYSYSGSLTTPPCSEGISWLVATELFSMEVDPYNALKDVVNFNSRFPQNELGEENLLVLSREALNQIEANDQGDQNEQ